MIEERCLECLERIRDQIWGRPDQDEVNIDTSKD